MPLVPAPRFCDRKVLRGQRERLVCSISPCRGIVRSIFQFKVPQAIKKGKTSSSMKYGAIIKIMCYQLHKKYTMVTKERNCKQ